MGSDNLIIPFFEQMVNEGLLKFMYAQKICIAVLNSIQGQGRNNYMNRFKWAFKKEVEGRM